jgi:hypothetical protein
MIDVEHFLMSLRRHKNADGKLKPIYFADTLQEEIEIIQEAIKHSQRWVGLTDEEINAIPDGEYIDGEYIDFYKAIENKLKEKNEIRHP